LPTFSIATHLHANLNHEKRRQWSHKDGGEDDRYAQRRCSESGSHISACDDAFERAQRRIYYAKPMNHHIWTLHTPSGQLSKAFPAKTQMPRKESKPCMQLVTQYQYHRIA
jgi:hypothetical protein